MLLYNLSLLIRLILDLTPLPRPWGLSLSLLIFIIRSDSSRMEAPEHSRLGVRRTALRGDPTNPCSSWLPPHPLPRPWGPQNLSVPKDSLISFNSVI